MPILLHEDATRPLPKMYRVAQSWPSEHIDDGDIEAVTREQLRRPEIAGRVKPGRRELQSA